MSNKFLPRWMKSSSLLSMSLALSLSLSFSYDLSHGRYHPILPKGLGVIFAYYVNLEDRLMLCTTCPPPSSKVLPICYK